MRLLVVSQYYWPEPFRITDICESLVGLGHQVDVLTSVPNVPGGSFYEGYGWFRRGEKQHRGVNIERVGVVQRKRGGALRLMLNCASFAVNSLFHIPKLKKNDYDAVFVFNNSPVTMILPAKVMAKKKNIPNVVFLLDIWPQSMFFLLGMDKSDEKGLFRRLAYAVSRWLYRSVDMMLLSSKGFEQKLLEMGIDCDTEYFPNYAETFEPTDFVVKREQLGIKKDDFVVGFSGNVGKAQGLEHTVEAVKKIKSPNVKWLIVGDGPELGPLKKLTAKEGVKDKYIFTGWVDARELPAYLEICDALFLPLKDQEVLNLTVPAKLQTYMYAAKPVVAFMNGAGANMVEQAGCGVTAAAEQPENLAMAIDQLSSLGEQELLEMGKNGREYCNEHFDKHKQIDNLVVYLEKAIEKHKKRKR